MKLFIFENNFYFGIGNSLDSGMPASLSCSALISSNSKDMVALVLVDIFPAEYQRRKGFFDSLTAP